MTDTKEVSYSYVISDLDTHIARTRGDAKPFEEPFVKIEATYDNSRVVRSATVTGLAKVSVSSDSDSHTVVGSTSAKTGKVEFTREDLSNPQKMFTVTVVRDLDNNLRDTQTDSVKIYSHNGEVYDYGRQSAHHERQVPGNPAFSGDDK